MCVYVCVCVRIRMYVCICMCVYVYVCVVINNDFVNAGDNQISVYNIYYLHQLYTDISRIQLLT